MRDYYEVTPHLKVVSKEAMVCTHELGSIPKGSGEIVERIVLEHVLRCRGEQQKIIM